MCISQRSWLQPRYNIKPQEINAPEKACGGPMIQWGCWPCHHMQLAVSSSRLDYCSGSPVEYHSQFGCRIRFLHFPQLHLSVHLSTEGRHGQLTNKSPCPGGRPSTPAHLIMHFLTMQYSDPSMCPDRFAQWVAPPLDQMGLPNGQTRPSYLTTLPSQTKQSE